MWWWGADRFRESGLEVLLMREAPGAWMRLRCEF